MVVGGEAVPVLTSDEVGRRRALVVDYWRRSNGPASWDLVLGGYRAAGLLGVASRDPDHSLWWARLEPASSDRVLAAGDVVIMLDHTLPQGRQDTRDAVVCCVTMGGGALALPSGTRILSSTVVLREAFRRGLLAPEAAG